MEATQVDAKQEVKSKPKRSIKRVVARKVKVLANENPQLVQPVQVLPVCAKINTRDQIAYPVSDDVLDQLDIQVERFNETPNLNEKMQIHTMLRTSIVNLEREIDGMLEIIEHIDADEIAQDHSDTDLNDDLVSIEQMVQGMEDEEVMQLKIAHYTRITQMIRTCKAKCRVNNMKVEKCN
jgi:hypothetical protein